MLKQVLCAYLTVGSAPAAWLHVPARTKGHPLQQNMLTNLTNLWLVRERCSAVAMFHNNHVLLDNSTFMTT